MSENDNLEYHIAFPAPEIPEYVNKVSSFSHFECRPISPRKPYGKTDKIHGNLTLLEDEEHTQIRNDCHLSSYTNSICETFRAGSEPVVFLLGWFNAQDRNLSKYSDLYKSLGCITIRYTAPTTFWFCLAEKTHRNIAEKLLKVMEETTLSHHPVIFHSMSNYGSMLYSHFSHLMEAAPTPPLQVVGCVFDSSPSPPRIRSLMRVVFGAARGSFFTRLLKTAFVCVGIFMWEAGNLLSFLFTGHFPIRRPWCLIKESFRWPQLFLYSKADHLVSYKDIETFANQRKDLGVRTIMHEFVDSPHVLHLKVHPEEYRETVNDFVKFCLRERKHVDGKNTLL